MAKIWTRQAVLRALDDAMSDDPTVILMGEDVAAAGGPFKVTEGLLSYGFDLEPYPAIRGVAERTAADPAFAAALPDRQPDAVKQ